MTLIKQLESKIEAWICEYDWLSDDVISSEMAETNSIFTWGPEDTDIVIEKAGETCYVFSCNFSLSGEHRDEELSLGEKIDVAIKGSISFQTDELDEDSVDDDGGIENWIIDDDYTVSASVNYDGYGDDIDEDAERANSIICELANMPNDLWFRGHADASWELKSTAARAKLKKHEIIKLRLEFEKRTTFLHPESYPLNRVNRIFLMRHHDIPTKIMDWSRSPLVALYFATQNEMHDKNDACIWLLKRKDAEHGANVEELLKCEDREQTPYEKTKKIVAIHSPYTNQRMVNQQSQFTLHRTYEDMAKNPELNLEKIIIPADTKPYLRKMLKTFGIDRGFLFPDYDNICAQIKEDILNDEPDLF